MTNWQAFKTKLLQLIGGLVMEDNGNGVHVISVGRTAFWITFAPAVVIWCKGGGMLENGQSIHDIAPNHLSVLLSLLGYNLTKHFTATARSVWGKDTAQVSVEASPSQENDV